MTDLTHNQRQQIVYLHARTCAEICLMHINDIEDPHEAAEAVIRAIEAGMRRCHHALGGVPPLARAKKEPT